MSIERPDRRRSSDDTSEVSSEGLKSFATAITSCWKPLSDIGKVFAACFLAFCVFSLGLVFFLGEDFFPSVDAGLMRLHVRARAGLRVEETARLCDEIEKYLRQEIPRDELVTILDNIGLPYSGINFPIAIRE